MSVRYIRGWSSALLLLTGGACASPAWAEDLTTLSGVTYHEVQPVRVEPDGVIWRHATGVCKVDFADSPRSVQQAYRYDAAKAVAYHDAQAAAREQANAQAQQLVQDHEDKQRARFQAAAAAATTQQGASGAEIILRRAASPAASAATRALAETVAADTAKQAAVAADSDTIGDQKVWSFAPRLGHTRQIVHRMDATNAEEYQASVHHAPGGYPATTYEDHFYEPVYMTRSYYEDVDRATAFIRGVPVKQ